MRYSESKWAFFLTSIIIPSLLLHAHTPSCSPYDWKQPNTCPHPVITVFFPGIGAASTQCAKYTYEVPLETGETAICSHAAPLIEHPFVGNETHETQPKISGEHQERIGFFSRAFRGIQEWGTQLAHRGYGIHVRNAPPDATKSLATHSTNISRVSMGQHHDIQEHAHKVMACQAQYPDAPLILWGVSRGAATTFSACALNQYRNVKLIVLEGCFDSIEHVFRSYPVIGKTGLHRCASWLLERLSQYRRDGICPLDFVNAFPEEIPVVFVTSKADGVVPPHCTINLATALAQRGKNHVYLITLEHSPHTRYMMKDPEDRLYYLHAIHALYEHHGLPHIAVYAQQGRHLLPQLLLSLEDSTAEKVPGSIASNSDHRAV